MEQIYYTQCPIGYGLGASNGFQIKRLGAGYPPSGDVRHLALRAFLPGSNGKQLAPGTLRYRRVDAVAEIAWLEPRAREYETERGQWGRPGGHFAHGLRLNPEEFEAISCWPAGLFAQPCWRRSDPEPSRGRRPDDLTIGPGDLIAPPNFGQVAPLIDIDTETLALLLSKVAEAVRTGRTLFLIDHPERLGPRIAAITFAFPRVLRPELTFSTYHDRPEELSGFRIHGTTPSAQLNRGLLASLGPIADLASDRGETALSLPSWARSLATWLTRRDPQDADRWSLTDSRARQAQRPRDLATLWSDPWLDGLIALAETAQSPIPYPEDAEQWRAFARQVAWAAQAGMVAELTDARSPRWWRAIARTARDEPAARDTFWLVLLSPETWADTDPADAAIWGAIAAYFWAREPSIHREQRLNAMVQRVTYAETLARFLDGLIRTLRSDLGQSALTWIERRGSIDPRALLPLRARNAVRLYLDRKRADALDQVIAQAITLRDTLPIVLDLIADEATRLGHPLAVAALLADRLGSTDETPRARFEDWALGRRLLGDSVWISAVLRRLFSTDLLPSEWDALRDRTDAGFRLVLTETCLEVAAEPESIPEAYRWTVEQLLLGLPEADRSAIDPRWAEQYVLRIGSPLDLAMRMREEPGPLTSWLDSAASRRPFDSTATALRADAGVILRMSDGHRGLPEESLVARLPRTDRPTFLGIVIDHLADGQFQDSRAILDRCARCWAGTFEARAEGLDQLAIPLAELLLQFLPETNLWIESLERLLAWISVDCSQEAHLRQTGIATMIVAETCRITADREAAWNLRSALLRHERFYATLAEDLARDLRSVFPKQVIDVSRRWLLSLDQGVFTGRFFEVLLNVCDGPRLAVVVPEYSAELWTLGPLPWWSPTTPSDPHPDLREAFARRIPMAPLADLRSRSYIEAWLFRQKPNSFRSILDDPDVPLDPDFEPSPKPIELQPVTTATPAEILSEQARVRWECVVALTGFLWDGKSSEARWADLMRWRKGEGSGAVPPLARLALDDRYAFLSWLLFGLESPETHGFEVESLARWVTKELGLTSRGRVVGGLDEIAARGIVVPEGRFRLARELAHEMGLQLDR